MFKKIKPTEILLLIAAVACFTVFASDYLRDAYGADSVELKTAERSAKSRLYAPPESSEPESGVPGRAVLDEEKININTASAAELATLPGIGEVRARAIIDFREKIGGFSSVSQLLLVDGIGEKTYEKIKDLCTV
ncbi:MAG: ComEA family DNA-binding protein [Clostridia bacterium]|nr:ComEA family DNA-binding protein [Clostridia bacterium]